MTDEELKAIEERAEKADPAPWQARTFPGSPWEITAYGDSELGLFEVHRNVESEYRANADFVVHARADVPALCGLVRKLQWELSEARNWLARFQNDHDAYALGMEVGQEKERRSNQPLLVQCRAALLRCCASLYSASDEFRTAARLCERLNEIIGDIPSQATSSPDAPMEAG